MGVIVTKVFGLQRFNHIITTLWVNETFYLSHILSTFLFSVSLLFFISGWPWTCWRKCCDMHCFVMWVFHAKNPFLSGFAVWHQIWLNILTKHGHSSTSAVGWTDVGHFAWGIQPWFLLFEAASSHLRIPSCGVLGLSRGVRSFYWSEFLLCESKQFLV